MNLEIKLSLDGMETDVSGANIYDIRNEIIMTVYQAELSKCGAKTIAVKNVSVILGLSETSVWRVIEDKNY